MMRTMQYQTFLACLCVIGLGACASSDKEEVPPPDFDRMAEPSVSVVPITPAEPARVGRISQDPVPIFRSPKIRAVKMDAYVNERGEAFPPSTKFVIEDPGGWNMDALRKPEVAFVPPGNSLEIPTAAGTKYTQMFQSSNAPGPEAGASRFLYDLEDVRITGFTEVSQEARARAIAQPSEAVIFDQNLGWIIVPKETIRASSPGAQARGAQSSNLPADTNLIRQTAEVEEVEDLDLFEAAPSQTSTPNTSSEGLPNLLDLD